jgi:hypothetical protein
VPRSKALSIVGDRNGAVNRRQSEVSLRCVDAGAENIGKSGDFQNAH